MICPKCCRCKKELDDYGAILLSPPDHEDKCDKYHICKVCFMLVWEKLGINKR